MNARNMIVMLALYLLATAAPVLAHCEIPCGIYGDDARFSAMEEDLTTIEKAMGQIAELAGKDDAQSANQLARWVGAKEEHANKIQHAVSQYFMTQRIKVLSADAGDTAMVAYTNKVVLLHKILRGAMKCKQTVDVGKVEAVRKLVQEFKHAYEMK